MARITNASEESIAEAAARLRAGGVVAFPTETVYGLGADTFNREAITLIYRIKRRPPDNPLIAHVLHSGQARRLVSQWDDRCDRIADHFWPGPLTLVLKKARDVPELATAGLPSIAVRAPRHLVARKLLEAVGSPISAPSANRSGGVSPTRAQHVADDFPEHDDLLILDGGPCEVGIESTVLDLTSSPPRVLRAGSVTADQLRQIVGELDDSVVMEQAPSPGTSAVHYAPRTPVELITSKDLTARLRETRRPMAVLCFDASVVRPPHQAIPMPRDPQDYAHGLYVALRQADALHCSRILIERPPKDQSEWAAVHDRLSRASAAIN